jgi:lysophospholipase L1-like esterase
VLIGVNDLIRLARRNESENGSSDAPCVLTCGPDVGARYDALLGWMRANMPATRIVVSALTPTTYYTVSRANGALGAAAARHGAAFVECAGAVDPRDRLDLPDGIHLSAAAHARLIACLRPAVYGALARPLPPGDAGPVPGPAALEAARPPPRVAAAAGRKSPPP